MADERDIETNFSFTAGAVSPSALMSEPSGVPN